MDTKSARKISTISHKRLAATKDNISTDSFSLKKYSYEDLIVAFERGRDKAHEDELKIAFTLFKDHLNNQATFIANDLIDWFGKSEINVYKVFLRANRLGDYDLLFLIDENIYEKNLFLKAYEKAGALRQDINNNNLNYSISFLIKTDTFEESAVINDGYFLTYRDFNESFNSSQSQL